MKKKSTSLLFFSLLFMFTLIFTSCNESNEIEKPDLELHGLSNLKLDIKFGLSKKTPLKLEKTSDFLAEKFNEIATMDNDLSLVISTKATKL
mgnify:FL=1